MKFLWTLVFVFPSLWAQSLEVQKGMLLDKAFSYYFSSDYQKAVEYFEKYLEQAGDDAVALRYLGRLYLIGQKPQKAIRYLQRSMKKNPKNIETFLLLARAYLQQKDSSKAIQAYEKVLALDPFHLGALSQLSSIYKFQKNFRKSAAYFKRIILAIETRGGSKNLMAQAYSSLANYYYKQGKYKRAIQYYEDYRALEPNNPRVVVVLGELYKMVGRFQDCISLLNVLLKQRPDYGPALESIIESMYIIEDPRTRAYLMRFVRNKKKISLLHQGMLWELSLQDEKAKQAFQQLLKSNSNRLAAHIGLAKIYQREGEKTLLRQEAFTVVLLAQKLQAAQTSYQYLSILYQLLQEEGEAIRFSKRFFSRSKEGALLLGKDVERLAKDFTELYETHADILQADGKPKQAVAYYSLAVYMVDTLIDWYKTQLQDLMAFHKNNPDSKTPLTDASQMVLKNQESIQKKIHSAQLKKYGIVMNLAWSLHDKTVNRTKEALRKLRQESQQLPKHAQAFALMGVLEYDLGENNPRYYQTGFRHLKKAIEIRRSQGQKVPASFYFYYALHAEKLQKYHSMEQAMQEALKREPYNSTFLNFLGYMYSLQNKKLNKAEALLLRALEDEPRNHAYLDSYGWILFKKGQYRLAFENLMKAKEIAEKKKVTDMVIYYHLAETYYQMKEYRLALENYKKVYYYKGKIQEKLPREQIYQKIQELTDKLKQSKANTGGSHVQ